LLLRSVAERRNQGYDVNRPSPNVKAARSERAASVSNFIRQIVDADLAAGTYAGRTWSGVPGPASAQAGAATDPARIRTRFPPEPNGYLHIGHAKSICLNFGLAQEYGGICHMRFDDTNPTKEEQEYVDSILDAVHWLGFDWGPHLYYASDYFGWLYEFAEEFIKHGLAYVDDQTAEEIRASRGTFNRPGRLSPFRDRPVEESLDLFRRMKSGEFPDGSRVLRLKIEMAHPNINMRDPVAYRIRHAEHHRTGEDWCVYPMYDFTHGVSDALENITHSICTLEFEDHRPLYNWINERLADFGCLARPLPQQIEFARLNLTYTVLSKRKLIQLVDEGHVAGWDDPRMPTIVGYRRRGYSPEALRLFAERIGVSKENSVIDVSILEEALRDDLNERAPRATAVLDPLKLIIDNYPEGQFEQCQAPVHPHKPEMGKRVFPFGRELWIEREDFAEAPPKGYFRLFPGNSVRLRYGYVVQCTGCDKDAAGNVVAVHCEHYPDSRSGTPGADAYKVKGNIHWVCAVQALQAEIRLYDRLFKVPFPGSRKGREETTASVEEDDTGKAHVAEEKADYDFLDDINPDSVRVITAYVEPGLKDAAPEDRFQFERHGYFVADPRDSRPGKPVFNRAVTLKDSWGKQGG
jgi:glutaminyl-tRNA synthetase